MLSAIALSNLTFTLPLSKTGNNVSIDLSSYDTIALRNTALSSYLPLSGGMTTGKITINPSAYSSPSSGVSGGTGDKIVLFNGGTDIYPYSIGINANML